MDATIISNRFIDEYMISANDAQIKIYLYLVRMNGANLPFSISDIADQFNYTEKDVMRALTYWENKHLISLDYDAKGNLKALHILPFPAKSTGVPVAGTQAQIVNFTPKPVPVASKTYSADDLVAFKSNNETAQIIFIAEQYTGKMLSRSDIETLLFIYDHLGFSSDLIDYLIQYCVDRGKKQFSYMQKVAIDWSESHITTVKQAQSRANKYNKQVYGIMKALGKSSDPTDSELNYIKKWTNEFGFSLDLILKACEKTVMATDRNRFPYCNSILTNWHESNVKTLQDVASMDESHATTKVSKSKSTSNGFNDFSQRNMDYDLLEKMLLNN